MRGHVLVIDDEKRDLDGIVMDLSHAGLTVEGVGTGQEGLARARSERFDLIVLDVHLGGAQGGIQAVEGVEVCRRLRDFDVTRRVPILLLTRDRGVATNWNDVGASDYLRKPYSPGELVARAKYQLSQRQPFDGADPQSILSVTCAPGTRIAFRSSGSRAVSGQTQQNLSMDSAVLGQVGDEAVFPQWRLQSAFYGNALFERLFLRELLGEYREAVGDVRREDRLHLRFETRPSDLPVPFEFLHDGTSYVVRRHPLARRLQGIATRREAPCRAFFNKLWSLREKLRVLLIASDTGGIPGVDREVCELKSRLAESFESHRILADVDHLETTRATLSEVETRITTGGYHIVHYAGHGFYDHARPESSSLLFWDRPGGDVKELSAENLEKWLKNTDVRFVYLSCCEGTRASRGASPLLDSFLGIAHAVVRAEVPAVLGFRWPVADDKAVDMAVAFYESLAAEGELDTALLKARQSLPASEPSDPTWLAPILILQADTPLP